MLSCRLKNSIKLVLREHRLATSQRPNPVSPPFVHFSTKYRNSFSANIHLIIQPFFKNTQAGLGIVQARNFFSQSLRNDPDTPRVNHSERKNLSLSGELGFFKQVLSIIRDPEDKEHELVDLKGRLNGLGKLSKSEGQVCLELNRLFKRIRLDSFTIKQVGLLKAEYENDVPSGMFYGTRTYNYLIYYYSSIGKIEYVEGVFEKMQLFEVPADELTYTFLIDAYANQGNLEKARFLFEQLQSKMQITSLHPYANLIKACIKNNQLSLAFDILKQIKFKPNYVIFMLLIQACIKARDIDEAWRTFELMRKSNCEIGLKVCTLMMSCARESETDKAIEIFEEMLRRDIFPTRRAVHGLLSALSTRASLYPKAVHILDLALKDNHFRPNAMTFKIMLNAAQISHRLKDARLFFSKIIVSVGNDPEAFPAYSSLFLTYASAFQPDDLQRTFNPQSTTLTLQAILDLPVPRTIDEAVEEARLIMADFESNIQTEGVLLTRVRQSYTVILANYGYFSEASEAFASYFIRTSITPHPGIFRSMLRMCYSLKKQRAFDRFNNHLMDLLAPIRPASQLTVRQKKDYQITNCLLGPVLDDIYSDLIRGLTTFNRLTQAFELLEESYHPCMGLKLNLAHSKPLLKKIRQSEDIDLQARLEAFLTRIKISQTKVSLLPANNSPSSGQT